MVITLLAIPKELQDIIFRLAGSWARARLCSVVREFAPRMVELSRQESSVSRHYDFLQEWDESCKAVARMLRKYDISEYKKPIRKLLKCYEHKVLPHDVYDQVYKSKDVHLAMRLCHVPDLSNDNEGHDIAGMYPDADMRYLVFRAWFCNNDDDSVIEDFLIAEIQIGTLERLRMMWNLVYDDTIIQSEYVYTLKAAFKRAYNISGRRILSYVLKRCGTSQLHQIAISNLPYDKDDWQKIISVVEQHSNSLWYDARVAIGNMSKSAPPMTQLS